MQPCLSRPSIPILIGSSLGYIQVVTSFLYTKGPDAIASIVSVTPGEFVGQVRDYLWKQDGYFELPPSPNISPFQSCVL